MLLDKFKARSDVKVPKASGTDTNKLEERSNDVKELASGAKDAREIEVRELSARERCLRKRHFVYGKLPMRFNP